MSDTQPSPPGSAVHTLDDTFLQILQQTTFSMVHTTEDAVRSILRASTEFLSESAQRALSDFYSLYFGSKELTEQKHDINAEVTALFESIKEQVESGGDTESVVEDEAKKKARLSLAAFQKQLETLITFESGIREKLVPVLMSMQFEDAVRQRLMRLIRTWELVFDQLSNSENISISEVKEQIRSILGSQVERTHFYRVVLKQEPPPSLEQEETWLESFVSPKGRA